MNSIRLLVGVYGLLVSVQLWSQCPDSILLSTQIDVDNFEVNYGQCSEIQWLIISGDDIQNLNGLSSFKELHGNLVITNNPMLSSLAGLDSLQFVSGSAYIYNNNVLTNLNGLSSLRSVSNVFIISDNLQMVNLQGMDSLSSVSLFALGNLGITSLTGLEHLARFGGPFYLKIEACSRLKSLSGLDSLTRVHELSISECDSLMSLDGLEQLQEATVVHLYQNQGLTDISALLNARIEHLYIRNIPRLQTLPELQGTNAMSQLIIFENDSLLNIDGLSHVTLIGSIQIDSNPLLESILGLSGAELTGSSISIRENPNLDMCHIPFLCDYAQQINDVNAFHGNAFPCASAPAILSGCLFDGGSGSGRLYLDMNCNQEFDATDFVLPYYLLIRTDNGLPVSLSDADGIYRRYLGLEDTITYSPKAIDHFISHPTSYTLATGSEPVFYDTLDFALCPDSVFHSVGVSVVAVNNFVRGFHADVQVCTSNSGTYPESGTLQLDFENFPNAEFVDIISADGGGQIDGKRITWDVQDIIPFQTACFHVTIRIDPGVDLGSHISAEARVVPESKNEEDPSDNVVNLTEEVVGSFDPNDKKVDHEHIPQSEEGLPLEYTIRFQNTGTFPATFVEIRDTLPFELDLSSFEMLAASHDYILSFPEPRILHWLFNPIHLPDSTSNEPESHGFIRYRIYTLPELSHDVEIRNSASIYFDFNAPVRTDDALTIVEKPGSTETVSSLVPISVYPNPAGNEVLVTYLIPSGTITYLRLIALDGTVVFTTKHTSHWSGVRKTILSVSNLASGLYFLHLVTPDGVAIERVVISH